MSNDTQENTFDTVPAWGAPGQPPTRRKLGKGGEQIETVRGFGYKFREALAGEPAVASKG